MLLDKYLYGRPTYRLGEELSHLGLPLAQGTVTDGLPKIAALFEPLMPLLRQRQMGEKLFHGDETRWKVFEEVEGKTGKKAKHCPVCGEAFLPFPGSEESDMIEVEVQAHMRRIHRTRYQKGCECPQVPGIITPPPAPRLIPKSP